MVVQMRMVRVGLCVRQWMGMTVWMGMVWFTLWGRHLQAEGRQVSVGRLHEGVHHEIYCMETIVLWLCKSSKTNTYTSVTLHCTRT